MDNIHPSFLFGLLIFLWGVWQKRGDGKPGTAPPSRPADATSTEAKAK